MEGPEKFDLVAVKDVKEYIGENKLTVGRCTQIRLNIENASVTINGTEYDMKIPSEKVKLVKSFVIEENKNTTIVLDFDAEESIHESGDGKYIMKPVIKVLIPSLIKTKEQTCIESGGEIKTVMCCKSTDDFPNTCLIGPCGCSPDNSHDVKLCDCGEGKCFNGEECTETKES